MNRLRGVGVSILYIFGFDLSFLQRDIQTTHPKEDGEEVIDVFRQLLPFVIHGRGLSVSNRRGKGKYINECWNARNAACGMRDAGGMRDGTKNKTTKNSMFWWIARICDPEPKNTSVDRQRFVVLRSITGTSWLASCLVFPPAGFSLLLAFHSPHGQITSSEVFARRVSSVQQPAFIHPMGK